MRDGELLPLRDRICCSGPVVPLMQHEDGGSGVQGFSSSFQLSASPAALPNQKPFTSCPVLIGRAIWVVVVFPERLYSSFNCQTRLFGKLLKPNFYMMEQILWLHIIAKTYLLWHVLMYFIH